MKRILSVFLCAAMLLSMVAMSASAWSLEEADELITNTNEMSFTLNKDSYKPGDTVTITATMDSIWGDSELEGDIPGYEDLVLPNAYGMDLFTACLVFPLDVFTPKAGNDFKGKSDIIGYDDTDMYEGITVTKTGLSDAKKGGYYTFLVKCSTFNVDEDMYGSFNGSGDLCKWNLTINEDAKPGTYKLPVGPYCITDYETGAENGLAPTYEFFGQWYADIGNSDTLLYDRDVNYNSPTGEHVNNDPTNGAYITIVVEGNATEEDKAAAAEFDALVDAIDTDIWAAGQATKVNGISITGFDLYKHFSAVSGSKFEVSFKMIPGKNGDGFGYFGGTTDASNGSHNIFWNQSEKKFQIAKVSSWMDAREVVEVLAETPALDLPEKQWTNVKFIYDGSYMAVEMNGVIVCSTNAASTGYSFYILYPNQVELLISDMKVTGPFGTQTGAEVLPGAAYVDVTLDSGAAIAAAEAAYAELSDAAKYLVTKKDALDALRAEYDALVNNDASAALMAGIVETMIANIGEVVYFPGDATDSNAAITAAETAYASLTDAAKDLVSNYATLTAAREEWNGWKVLFDQAAASDVDTLIAAIGEVTFESRAAIEAAEAAYAALTDDEKAYVTLYETLVAAREAYNMYGPIMNVEILADAIGSDFFQGYYSYGAFTSTNGYADVKVNGNQGNTTGDFELNFDFVYTAANLSDVDDSGIALFRSDATYAGYNFAAGGFMIGKGGAFYSGNKTPEIVAITPYELVAGKVYNMTIKFAGATASVYLDGELMVTADAGSGAYDWAIFYPMNANVYFANSTLALGDAAPVAGGMVFATPLANAGIDVLAPVDIQAKVEAAEAALAALNDEQLALLDDKFETAIADARAELDVKLAAIQADADAVEALIAAIKTEDDANKARAAFFALTPGAQTLVENYEDLNNALVIITEGYIDAIGAVSDVTPDSEAAIFAAESAFYALTPAERELVKNYDTLVAARKEVDSLKKSVASAMAVIDMLKAGGSAIVNNADHGALGSYSQYEDNAKIMNGSNAVAEYAFAFDIYVDRLNDETNAYFGGSSSNNVFVGYDLVRKTVFVANDGPWGYNSAAETVIAEADFDLELQKWYNFKFILGDTTAYIYVDGELVLETAITEPAGWFIYYPKNNVSYYDNVEFWYNGEKQTSMSQFTSVGAGNWTALAPAGDPGYYLTSTAPVGTIKADQALVDAAIAAYNAVPAKAQYAVTNYGLIAEAEAAIAAKDADAVIVPVQEAIDALDVPAANYLNCADVLAQKDAIVAAKALYEALDADQQAKVDATALEAAIASYQKALVYNANLNGTEDFAIEATGADELITITWDAVAGATKYYVYVNGAAVLATADTTATLEAPAGDYTVKVSAVITDAELGGSYIGAVSNEVAVAVTEAAPATLTVEATATENSITATWNALADGTVYYVTFNVGGTDIVVKTTNASYTLAKYVAADTDYTVTVKALVPAENGYEIIDSNVAEGTTDIANFRVTDAALDTEAQTLTITWNETEGATAYYVVATNNNSGVVTTVRVAENTATITARGTSYDIVVKAVVDGKIIATDLYAI